MVEILVTTGDEAIVKCKGELYRVRFGETALADTAEKITSTQANTIMAHGGWYSQVPYIMQHRVEVLFN